MDILLDVAIACMKPRTNNPTSIHINQRYQSLSVSLLEQKIRHNNTRNLQMGVTSIVDESRDEQIHFGIQVNFGHIERKHKETILTRRLCSYQAKVDQSIFLHLPQGILMEPCKGRSWIPETERWRWTMNDQLMQTLKQQLPNRSLGARQPTIDPSEK